MAAQCRNLDEINVSANSSTCVIFKVEGRTKCMAVKCVKIKHGKIDRGESACLR